ncbi:MAG: zinc ribbon domain-containing protein, partial [Caulobacteraceae bacterium]|nr:zinc ribbon domain-containing protein [Caulobacter sp.]
MAKGLRLSETWFQRGLWLIAFLFAAFLIGLGSLVVADLPRVERPVSAEAFMDQTRLAAEQHALAADDAGLRDLADSLTRARLALSHAQAATASERDSFNTWISTRTATQQSSQDPEVLARTHALDTLKAAERQQQTAVEALETRQTALEQDRAAHSRTLDGIREAGEAGYNRAIRQQELRVFGLRLLLTLPLLLLAVWLFARKRKSPRWPFVWGFIFFALFTFFFELVPYLPSYGGYLRYLVGLALTVWAGNYAITALRRYLEAQKAAEQRPEPERRQDLGYEAAQMRLARKICPACERPLDTADPTNNFCMNCGLLVFEPCPRCTTRQTTFS